MLYEKFILQFIKLLQPSECSRAHMLINLQSLIGQVLRQSNYCRNLVKSRTNNIKLLQNNYIHLYTHQTADLCSILSNFYQKMSYSCFIHKMHYKAAVPHLKMWCNRLQCSRTVASDWCSHLTSSLIIVFYHHWTNSFDLIGAWCSHLLLCNNQTTTWLAGETGSSFVSCSHASLILCFRVM